MTDKHNNNGNSSNNKKKYDIKILKYEDEVPIFSAPSFTIRFQDNQFVTPFIKKEVVQGVDGAFTLHNVLTPDECKQFIDLSESMGYDLARISTFGGMVKQTNTRNNKRVMYQSDISVWKPIWKRVKKFIPQLNLRGINWIPYGLNERLRFYRYSKGEVFVQHYDGCYPRSYEDKSFITFIIYLNDNFEDGHTTFFPTSRTKISVKPVGGSALLFWHGNHPSSPLHEGSLCTGGMKYVLRSDVMYCTEGVTPFITVSDDEEQEKEQEQDEEGEGEGEDNGNVVNNGDD